MCGIAGYWDKTDGSNAPVGMALLDMLTALARRGPDSAGVALYSGAGPRAGGARDAGGGGENGDRSGDLVVRISAPEIGRLAPRLSAEAERCASVRDARTAGPYLRLIVEPKRDPEELMRALEAVADEVEVISMGARLEIVKQVGSPAELERDYCISQFRGSHGIGHTRLSTESRVDLSHSQPFWAHGRPDLAIVHNGHITNYHQLRRRYQQKGVRFYTGNDSEVVGVYLAERLREDPDLERAFQAALGDLDGSFSCLAATADAFGFVKDPFALKPLLVAETGRFAAVATEEVALRAAFPGDYPAREAQAREIRVWRR